jgi:DNA-binding NarL/FixJ family response regulator
MRRSIETCVVMFAIDAAPESDLLRIALGHGWSVRRPASASAGFEELLRCRPRVAVVQVSGMLGEDLEMIRLMRAGSLPVSVVAIAVTHGEEIELAVRGTGVDCYLSMAADATLIERAVSEILGRQERGLAPDTRVWRRGPDKTNSLLLSPFPSDQSWAAGFSLPAAHSDRQGE